MSNFFQRLILFSLGIPALIGISLYAPAAHLPLWNLLVILLTGAAGGESARLFQDGIGRKGVLVFGLIAALFPAAAFLELNVPGISVLPPLASLVFLLMLAPAAFGGNDAGTGETVRKTSSRLASSLYPGVFMLFLVKMTAFPRPELKVLLFITIIFSNDTCAYLAGRLFGKRSPHPFAVSPNKTVAGFIGGFTGALVLGLLYTFFLPEALPLSILPTALIILLIAFTANTGDLVESAFKRSAGVKDSGTIMPGRGGILDSVDSVLFSAPVFYYIVQHLCN